MGAKNYQIGHFWAAVFGLISMVVCQDESPPPQFCGVRFTDPFVDRIVSGSDAIPHQFPWLGKLYDGDWLTCGTALIADKYSLTAAHCVTSYIPGTSVRPKSRRGFSRSNLKIHSPENYTIELGAHDYNEKSPGVVRARVEKITLHPRVDYFQNHDVTMYAHDIAILKTEPVTFSWRVLPICLPDEGYTLFEERPLFVAGWGSTETRYIHNTNPRMWPKILQKATLNFVPFIECRRNPFVGKYFTLDNQLLDENIFCAMNDRQGICQGDSGGPVVARAGSNAFTLVGLVSWTIGCNMRDHPSGFVRVAAYIKFIEHETRDGHSLPRPPGF